jgi:hypothetical protein
MRKIISILAACVLAVGLTNCAPTADIVKDKPIKVVKIDADSVIEKVIKFAKIGHDENGIKQVEAAFTAEVKAQYKKELKAVCNKDDLKKIDSLLDCFVNAGELNLEAQDDQAKEAAQEAANKCAELPKPQEVCGKQLDKLGLLK